MNWSAVVFWALLIGGALLSVVGLVLTFMRKTVEASE